MLEEIRTAVPRDDDSRVLSHAVAESARRLDIRATDLGRIIGTSQPSASRLLHGKWQLPVGTKPFELGVHLVRLYRSLSALVGGSDELARTWLATANDDLGGVEPRTLLKSVEGLVHVCDYVDACRARV